MKKFIKIILMTCISSLLLIGCSSKKSDENVDNFINTLISAKTYENIDFSSDFNNSIDESTKIFGEYLTEDGLGTLIANRIPSLYYNVIAKNTIIDTEDIKIVKTKEKKEDNFISYEYEVSYKLKSDNKSIDMKDYMAFKVMKDKPNLINEVYVSEKKSSIFSEFKSIVQ